MKKAVIIVPTFNEVKNIEKLVESVFEVGKKLKEWELNILVVDSDSPDGTANIVKKLKTQHKNLYLIETKKEGLGRAYVSGFTYALSKLHPDALFEMDADFSHDPKSIPLFIEILDSGSDFVIGTRYRKGGSIPNDWALHRKFFSVIGNIIIRLGFMKPRITDWTSGYRCIRATIAKDILEKVENYTGYVFQIALLDNALKHNARIDEIPIQFIDRRYGESKIDSFRYIIDTLWYVFLHSSFVKYIFVGLGGFIIDFGLLYVLRFRVGLFIWLSQLISAELAIIFNFILNNYWSFSYKQIDGKSSSFAKSFFKFNLVASGSIIIQSVLLETCAYFFGEQYLFLYKVLILGFIIIPYSYFLYNRVVWKTK
ncbi:MAG: glycosyltransferase family 2 protein [Patescibacteria group bacterium]